MVMGGNSRDFVTQSLGSCPLRKAMGMAMSCTCGNPKAALTLKVTSVIAHTGISILLPSPTLQSFTEN